MHPTNRNLRFGALVLVGLAVGGTIGTGQEPVPPPRPANPPMMRTATGAIVVPIGVSQTLGMSNKKPIAAVRVNVEGIVRVSPNAVDQSTVIVTGLAPGTARLFLTDVDGREEAFDIIVQLDVSYLKRFIADTVPSANVDVRPMLNRGIILSGWVAKAEDVDVVMRIATTIMGGGANIVNAMQVGGVMQVQLDVTVARVNRTEARQRGFAFAYNGAQVSFASIMSGLVSSAAGAAAPGAGVGVIPGQGSLVPGSGANIIFGIVPANIQMLIQALRSESLATLLAEPKLVTLSGRPANFLAGGSQAILSPSGGLGGPGVAYRDVGTELDFLPIVMGNGRIYLEVNPVVRSVNNARGITTAFGFVPGFDEQRIRTAVELEPGQTMAIGGLIQTEALADSSRIPVLGDLPYIGTLFSRVSHTEQEQELVILVTPHLVDGQDCKQVSKRLPGRETRSPDDYELFLEGLLEAPRGQRQVFENGKYKAAYKNDPSLERFPCADPLAREDRPKKGKRSAYGCENCAPPVAPAVAPAGPVPARMPVMNPTPANMPVVAGSDGRLVPQASEPYPASPVVSGAPVPPTAVRPASRRTPPPPVIPLPADDEK